MSEAARDQNHIPSALGVSSTDATLTLPFKIDPLTGRLLTDVSGGGTGDVVGPASATDNAVARFDGTTGKLIQNSVVTIADTTGNMAGVGTINTLTLPSSNFVGLTDAQTLTNKVINGANNTITVRLANDVTGNLPVGNLNSGTSASATTFWRGDGTWATPAGAGTVTSVSVVSANGFAGSVATATSTPAITISTTITGILKGNGTAISAATAGTDYVTDSSTNTFTNKTYDTAGVGNSLSINGVAATANTGTGAVARAAGPTFTTPTLGVASATTINKLTITTPATGATLTIVDGGSLITAGAFALTLTATAASNATIPAGTNTLYSTKSASISSAALLASMSDATGTGASVFATSPTLVTPVLGTPTSGTLTNCTGLPIAGLVSSTSTALGVGSLELGAASDTTLTRVSAGVIAVEGVTVDTASNTLTLTNKTLTSSTNVLGGVTLTLGSDANYDMYYRSSGGVLTRLANGTTGQVLTATTSNAPSWAAAGASTFIGCRVYNSASQSIGTSATVVTFDSESFDTDTMHNTGSNTGRITFTTAGYYQIEGTIATATNAVVTLQIRLNGTTTLAQAGVGNSGSSANGFTIATTYLMSAADYVEILCAFGSTVNTISGLGGSHFTAYKIG